MAGVRQTKRKAKKGRMKEMKKMEDETIQPRYKIN